MEDILHLVLQVTVQHQLEIMGDKVAAEKDRLQTHHPFLGQVVWVIILFMISTHLPLILKNLLPSAINPIIIIILITFHQDLILILIVIMDNKVIYIILMGVEQSMFRRCSIIPSMFME